MVEMGVNLVDEYGSNTRRPTPALVDAVNVSSDNLFKRFRPKSEPVAILAG